MRGFLHRLAREVPTAPLAPVDSVVGHLQALLNTQRGSGPCAPSFGVELDVLLRRWPDSRAEILSRLHRTIEACEPRLENLKLSALNASPGRLRILIEADLGTHPLELQTELTSAGEFSISTSG